MNRGGDSSGKDLVVSAENKRNEEQLSQQVQTQKLLQAQQLTENFVELKEKGEATLETTRPGTSLKLEAQKEAKRKLTSIEQGQNVSPLVNIDVMEIETCESRTKRADDRLLIKEPIESEKCCINMPVHPESERQLMGLSNMDLIQQGVLGAGNNKITWKRKTEGNRSRKENKVGISSVKEKGVGDERISTDG